ncbi:hypothetical protein IED13_19285 [Bosea sp. SSUT16]|uniref:Uncharacterized protein n=1 Tax=Bosea spartocytisi TaxID=2773451 RepID=A0A927EFA8_9HYPH|nr:hypothetical protein [Bosea spartocytisi]MBD3847849.1 hypothetical protein [Bosea spartocytisi]MCT4471475.1 hypothetical protein [Bosea spartocytisi]
MLEHTRFLTRGSNGNFRFGPELWRLGSLYRRSFDLVGTPLDRLKQGAVEEVLLVATRDFG